MHDFLLSSVFEVGFENGSIEDASFQRVSGLSKTLETTVLKSGGLNAMAYNVPTGMANTNIVLERGMIVKHSAIGKWVESILNFNGENHVINPKSVTISLIRFVGSSKEKQGEKEVNAKWTFYDCYPVRWSISDFSSQTSELAIETLELTYSHFEREQN